MSDDLSTKCRSKLSGWMSTSFSEHKHKEAGKNKDEASQYREVETLVDRKEISCFCRGWIIIERTSVLPSYWSEQRNRIQSGVHGLFGHRKVEDLLYTHRFGGQLANIAQHLASYNQY